MTPSGPSGSSRSYAAAARDAALARVGHARRWAILGSAGLSAGFAALVSASPPSHASTTKARTTTARTPAASATPVKGSAKEPALPPLADGAALGLQGPGQAPGDGSGSGGGQDQSQSAPASPQPQSAPAPAPTPAPQPQAPVSGGS